METTYPCSDCLFLVSKYASNIDKSLILQPGIPDHVLL